jgi:hypothetical protein
VSEGVFKVWVENGEVVACAYMPEAGDRIIVEYTGGSANGGWSGASGEKDGLDGNGAVVGTYPAIKAR